MSLSIAKSLVSKPKLAPSAASRAVTPRIAFPNRARSTVVVRAAAGGGGGKHEWKVLGPIGPPGCRMVQCIHCGKKVMRASKGNGQESNEIFLQSQLGSLSTYDSSEPCRGGQ